MESLIQLELSTNYMLNNFLDKVKLLLKEGQMLLELKRARELIMFIFLKVHFKRVL